MFKRHIIAGLLVINFMAFSHSIFADKILVDGFEESKLTGIYSWPTDKPNFSFSKESKNGKQSLKIDSRESANITVKLLPQERFKKANPYAISFWIKAAPGNQLKKINILLGEKKGREKYFIPIDLKPEWTLVEIKYSDLKIFPFGGSKVINGTLDAEDICDVRFSTYPGGAVFLVDDISIFTNKPAAPAPKADAKLITEINEIDMSGDFPDYSDRYPLKTHNVKIQNGNFMRDGKPSFILGGWQMDNEGQPWLLRTLGIDVYPYNATEIYTLYHPVKEDGKLKIEWKENEWYESIIHRTLKNGLMFWQEHKADARYNVLKKVFPEVVGSGHFVAYDPFNPLGIRFYDEMVKSWMRYTRKYPIFCYEMFNEMGYNNQKQITKDMFKRKARQKYETIAIANKAWDTQFESFNDVRPPGFVKLKNEIDPSSRALLIKSESKKYANLHIDWRKFQEETCEKALANIVPSMRQYDPSPDKFSTVQSHSQLFFDYGDTGVHPEAITKNVDFYTHEIAQSYFEQDFKESITHAKTMVRMSLTNDIVRNISKKPIFNGESPLSVSKRIAPEEEMISGDLVNLHSQWKFSDGTEILPAGWNAKKYDDSSWASIAVPGMWGKQGFPKCKVGLYRKHCTMPDTLLTNGEKVFLNGKAFSDMSEVFFNGEIIGKTKGYQSSFSFEVTKLLKKENVIAVKIINNYFKEGMFFGGIRGYVSLNNFPSTNKNGGKLAPKHYRAHLWSQIAHGMSGVMVCYDNALYKNAAKVLPRVKKEIESVAEIVMPRPRINANIALVYPFETLRGVTHAGYMEKLSGPATKDLSDFYAPLLFSGQGVDVITNKNIAKDPMGKYKAIVMSGNIRAVPGEMEALQNYVKNGGILIADFNSLSINDNTHNQIDAGDIFGIKLGAAKEGPQKVTGEVLNGKTYTTNKRFVDGKNQIGIAVNPGTKVLATFADGSAAVTVNHSGKGKAYYIAAKLSFTATETILAEILKVNEIKPRIDVSSLGTALKPRLLDVNLFGDNGRYVLYALNYGKKTRGILKASAIDSGNYRVRNIATGNTLKPINGKESWTSTELETKLALEFPSLDPVVLLIEKVDLKPLVIKNISPERRDILNQLWVKRKTKTGAPVVALAPTQSMTNNYGDQPTASKLLDLSGFETVSYAQGKTKLKDTKVLLLLSSRHQLKNQKEIIEFVKNGGGLLICGNGITNYHMTLNGTKELLSKFKINQPFFKWLKNPSPDFNNDLLNVTCKDITPDPLSENVESFVSSLSGIVRCNAPGAKTIIKSPKDSNLPEAPVMVSFPYGKGRVVYIADSWWVRPLNLERGDNAQLFLNTVNWLAKREPEKISPEKFKQAFYITSARLQEAEKAENEGRYTFEAYDPGESSLSDEGELNGTAGGDPIVDMLK